ncbi:DUF3443 domain-containing protein [Herbaspirillum sp. HC18]|nr:DUF3443 domain-containing protein [Herbaspirillum sp. HC18]
MRRIATAICAIILATAAGCGGGGGGSSGNPQAGPSTGNAGTPPAVAAAGQNVIPITVTAGPLNNVNVLTASVTVCAPDGTSCQTIDNMLVDTGSTGLRVYASVLSAGLALALQQQSLQQSATTAECAQFADGAVWGPVRQATLIAGGKAAANLPIHVMGDGSFNGAPADCVSTGPLFDTVQSFGANGVLGIGLFLQDCGPACAQAADNGVYYSCGATCRPAAVPLAQQMQNPVSLFASDNNGVAIALPAVPPNGAATVSGSLIFGIGTQANNVANAGTVLATDPNLGYFTTVYKNRSLSRSFIDSGSNGFFFADSTIPTCNPNGDFYCPPATQSASATNQGANGVTGTVAFSIGNANALFSSDAAAFNSLAGPNGDRGSFDWGLSFFFGRTVFTAIEGRATPQGTGPYFAY